MYRGASANSERFDAAIRHSHINRGDGTIVDVYETPRGTIREVHTFTPESPYIPFPTEYSIKTWEDLDAYLCLTEHTLVEPDYQRLGELINAYPDAMVTAGVTDTPLPALMTKLIGTENFVFMHSEDRVRIRQAMDAMQGLHRQRLEAAALGPAEVYICYENTNTNSFGIRWIEEYELPWLNEYADILHAAGKKLLVHMCGRIRLVIEQIATARFDGIIDVAPPPTGDCDVAAAAHTLSQHGKTLGGGIGCTTFILQDADRFEHEVRKLVNAAAGNPRFMLGSGDAVPQGATEENLRRAGAIAKGCRLS
jgi:uroporphyrinogen-III decarboxylase